MPETAAEQGLRDPWNPASSIAHAARLLVDLHQRFGNLGLAAAAYNAGPGRLSNWLQGSGLMPAETRRYVRLVTGRPLERWIGIRQTSDHEGARLSCAGTIAEFRQNGNGWGIISGAWQLSPFVILPDGDVVARKTGQPLTAADRLAMHSALSRVLGLSSRR